MSAETTSEAVVLRRSETGEADRRLILLTREHGKVDVVAKGARKSGSRLAGSSEPLSRAIFTWVPGKVRRYVVQAQPLTSYPGIRSDYDRTLAALALVELVAVAVPFDSPQEESVLLFDWLTSALASLESAPRWESVLVWAEARLLDLEGVHPDWTTCAVTGASMQQNPAWVSPTAGGMVDASRADPFHDKFLVTSEALIALKRTAVLESPPENLKRAEECLRVLFIFWRHTLENRLPAGETLVQSLPGGQNGAPVG